MKLKIIGLILLVSLTLGACSKAENSLSSGAEAIDQLNLCEVRVWRGDEVAAICKPGQKIVYLPSSWGNAQLPVIFAAVNCDLRYGIAMTEGAVACVYSPIKIAPAEPPAAAENKPK